MPAIAASVVGAAPAAARRPPPGLAPSWAAAAQGACLWDRHGRRWLDMSGAAVLGHADPQVEAAAADPPADAERRAAQRLLAPLPGADAARFAPTADQALEAAVALAVRATDRPEVVHVSSGVAAPRLNRDVAAVVARPEALGAPLRAAADAAGALLIVDERFAGPRRGEGGAQRQAGVRADLAVWGAEIANGRPLGALTGEAELLRHLPEGLPGAACALAAADAALARFAREPVALHLAVRGAELQAELEALVAAAGLGDVLRVGGGPDLDRAGAGAARSPLGEAPRRPARRSRRARAGPPRRRLPPRGRGGRRPARRGVGGARRDRRRRAPGGRRLSLTSRARRA